MANSNERHESYGQRKLTVVDRFGVYLSKRAVLKWLPKAQPISVLDIGCGFNATLLNSLRPQIQDGTGIDLTISDELKKTPALTFYEGRIEAELPKLSEQSFDVILFMSVLEHLWAPGEILAHCHRLLKPGGTLLINVPTWRGKTFLEYSAFKLGTSPATEMNDHKMYYDKRDLWPLMVKSGFIPSNITMYYHKFGLNLFTVARK